MKNFPLLLSLISFIIYFALKKLFPGSLFPMSIFLIPVAFIIINLALRKRLKYKNWFLGPFNFHLERKEKTFTSDIPLALLFDKIEEVIAQSAFDLFELNKDEFQILCGTKANLLTWGETIYIQLIAEGKSTQINFLSISNYGSTSLNRNNDNFESFVDQFEASLTI